MIRHSLLVLIAIGLLYLGSVYMKRSVVHKDNYNLTSYINVEGEAPEIILATKLLGGFRGILIDILWLRAISLEQEGKYFELAQLFDLICKLEPRLPSVWSYASWNMAYNISKEIPDLDQKWQWVKAGISLLRDKGLKYCPREYKIYDDLAYMYYHKIGGITDIENNYYKQMFALEMDVIFGDNFKLEDCLNSKTLPDILKQKHGAEIIEKLKRTEFRRNIFRILCRQLEPTEEIKDFLKEYQEEETFRDAIHYYQKEMIEKELNMKIGVMQEVEVKYGRLDWRSAICYGLYWVHAGMKFATAKMITTERLETYILKDIFFFGSLYPVFDNQGKKYFEFGPDFTKGDILHKQYKYYLEKYPIDDVTQTFYYAYRQYLETMCIELYMRGELQAAEKYYVEGKPLLVKFDMPNSVKEFIDQAFKKALPDLSDQERIMMIYSPIERYYKDKFILRKADNNEQFFANFIVKNYKTWVEKKQKNKLPLPPSLKEIQILVIKSMLMRYQGLNQSYLDELKKEVLKLEEEVKQLKIK